MPKPNPAWGWRGFAPLICACVLGAGPGILGVPALALAQTSSDHRLAPTRNLGPGLDRSSHGGKIEPSYGVRDQSGKLLASRQSPAKSPASHGAIAEFRKLDSNDDGLVSAKEWQTGRHSMASLFILMDADNDGKLSRAEVMEASQGKWNADFARWDANQDGAITRGEFPKQATFDVIQGLDRDGDKSLHLGEIRPELSGTGPTRLSAMASEETVQSDDKKPAETDKAKPYCWVPVITDDDDWNGFVLQAPIIHSKECQR